MYVSKLTKEAGLSLPREINDTYNGSQSEEKFYDIIVIAKTV